MKNIKEDIEKIVDDCLLNGSIPTPHTTVQLTLEDIKKLHKTLSEGNLKNPPKFEGVEPTFTKKISVYVPDTILPLDTESLFHREVQKGFNITLDLTTDTP